MAQTAKESEWINMSKWIVDADQIQISDYDSSILYRNRLVDSFLLDDRKLGIKAPKGMGKTFLMKSKRTCSQKNGVLCLPKDSMCDILDRIIPSRSMGKYLEDYTNWIDLWKISICFSVIKALNLQGSLEQLDPADDMNPLEHSILFSPYIVTTCQIMNFLIASDRALVRRIQQRSARYLAIIRTIHQPVHIFIDKTDQALRDNLHYISGATKMTHGPSNNSLWSYGQVALAEASYQIFVQNGHIKVYYSVRSEAFLGAASYTNIYLQLENYIVELIYTYDELRAMFRHYVSVEEDSWLVCPDCKDTDFEKAFTGVNMIEHGYVREHGKLTQESFFEYMYRHTLKRPRDIMWICYKLCYSSMRSKDGIERLREIRHIVNQESRLILQAYIREMGPFVFDRDADLWDFFWTVPDSNVFTYERMQELCGLVNNASCDSRCNDCNYFKPFSSLYNAGLLGVISCNNVEKDPLRIRFLPTGHVRIESKEELLPKNSRLFFLHPMVTNKVESIRTENGNRFAPCRELVVGDNYPISEGTILRINQNEARNTTIQKERSVFLSSTCHDLLDYRKMLYRELTRYNYFISMSENTDFGNPPADSNSYDYCLDKVLECKHLIYIIGERYGGEYRGTRYVQYAEEIADATSGKLSSPSISLMEFYVALRNGKDVHAFIKKDIYNERRTYIQNDNSSDFKTFFAKDTRVFEIISFITNLKSGNWFNIYEDLSDLIEIVKIQFGDSHIQNSIPL